MNSQVWWFVARSSGIIAWALLTLSVVWGLLLSTKVSATRIAARKLRPAWILDLHRHLGGLAVIFTAIHLIGIAGDSYVTFGWADIFLPMASEWKPGAVAFGVVSMYLLVAIEATSLAIRHLSRTAWRWVHRTSFLLYATATYHGILAGTDAGNQWFRLASWISIALVVGLTIRLLIVLRRKSVADRRRPDVVESPEPAVVPLRAPAPSSLRTVLPPAMPLVAAIPPLPGTVNELAAPVGEISAPPRAPVQAPAILTPPVMAPPILAAPVAAPTILAPPVVAPTILAPPILVPPVGTPSSVGSSSPPPPPPPRPPQRDLAGVSSGGRGGDGLVPPPDTT